ncbi:MAG TPA: hypothetical protein VD835_09310 [Pyrinomonadaceae bacterium]|nr:hypothetical protein [Pyrinomonadaceae bacterium]
MELLAINLSFFAVGNEDGLRLAESFKELALAVFGIDVQIKVGATQTDFNRACLYDDIIVFDASVEEGHNYGAATAQPMVLDKVLVVSRSYLPLNFYGLREGGAPGYPLPKYQSNDAIIVWLREQVNGLLNAPDFEPGRTGLLHYIGSARKSLKMQEERWNNSGRVFVSYRSRHFIAAERLKLAVEQGVLPGVRQSPVTLLRPGELAYDDEVLTEYRHWQLVSMIDRKIGAAGEMWVYNTEDYLHSWWTRAELVTIAYRRASGIRTPTVSLFDPFTHKLQPAPDGLVPELTVEQRRRLARWYSNTDPGTSGPEHVRTFRLLAQLPLISRVGYFKDHVWSDNFWDEPLLPCEVCLWRNGPATSIDLGAFLWLREPHLVRLNTELLARSMEAGRLECPRCHTAYEIEQDAYPRYLWLPVRYGKPTGPDGARLVELPVYRARRMARHSKRQVTHFRRRAGRTEGRPNE